MSSLIIGLWKPPRNWFFSREDQGLKCNSCLLWCGWLVLRLESFFVQIESRFLLEHFKARLQYSTDYMFDGGLQLDAEFRWMSNRATSVWFGVIWRVSSWMLNRILLFSIGIINFIHAVVEIGMTCTSLPSSDFHLPTQGRQSF